MFLENYIRSKGDRLNKNRKTVKSILNGTE